LEATVKAVGLSLLCFLVSCDGESTSSEKQDGGSTNTGGTAGNAGRGGAAGGGQSGSAGASGAAGSSGSAGDAGMGGTGPVPSFRKITLSTEFYCEGATIGDFNGDDVMDVVAGPRFYAGPDFDAPTAIYDGPVANVRSYSDNFFAFTRDLSGDGWDDVFFVGFPGRSAYWYENPGESGAGWLRYDVVTAVGNESPDYTDITGDGEPELVFIEMVTEMTGRYGYAGPGADPREPWVFHPLSPIAPYSHFTHGMGTGDVNGDGRIDLLEVTGFWTQPASLDGDPLWQKVEQLFGGLYGGGQMAADDVDGDGDADVIATLAAHDYGLSWFENDGGTFVEHNIVPATVPTGTDVVMHEPHALTLADINGDGLTDIVTGERFWGHAPPEGEGDLMADPGRLYWFEARRQGGAVTFVPHLVDDLSGVGTQVVAADANDDDLLDIVVANKKGAFLFLQEPE
jgi:hypothetical protein